MIDDIIFNCNVFVSVKPLRYHIIVTKGDPPAEVVVVANKKVKTNLLSMEWYNTVIGEIKNKFEKININLNI